MSTTDRTSLSVKDARELYELKEKAAKFYAENGVPGKMEDILNTMFYDNPPDVYGYLANYFQGFATSPNITKIKSTPGFDSKAQTTIQTEIYCTVNNKEKCISRTLSSSQSPILLDTAKPEEREVEEKEREENVTAAIKLINNEINQKLQGLDPTKQQDSDLTISNLIAELKAAEDERLAKEAAERAESGESEESEKKPGSAVSKPKSGAKNQLVLENFLGMPRADRRLSITSKGNNQSASRASSRANSHANSRIGSHIDHAKAIKHLGTTSVASIGGKGGKGGGAPVVVVPDEPKEKLLCGCASVGAISQAICNAGSTVVNSELYEYIAGLKFGANQREYRLPLPMVTIFQSGKAAPGKSACVKEYMIVPKPGKPLKETIPQIMAIYNDVMKAILNKSGVIAKNVSDIGALMVPFDRPEQGLDLILEAMGRVGVTPGEDFFLALNLAGQEIFDYEKGKYEVITGQQKVADDLVEFWVELLGRYPAVIAIIDPMRKQEDRQWMLLCERISDKCFILGENVWHRPGLLKEETLPERFKTSGIVFKMEQMNTVSDIIECSKKMEEENNVTVLSTNVGETLDTFVADMAVGMNAMFIKIGAPCRGERVSKLNRLLVIEQQLEEQGKLTQHTGFTFPVITIPPEPETEEGEGEVEETPKEPKKK